LNLRIIFSKIINFEYLRGKTMIIRVMNAMIGYFKNDVKRINHALKVYNFAQLISAEYDFDSKSNNIICYSSILHDIGIKEAELKYNSTAGNYQELEGPPIARRILTSLDVSEEITTRVCFIIGNHHSYSKIDGLDFQILVEADFIVNIFEDQLTDAAINNIYTNIFKTNSGKKILETMYKPLF